MRIDYISIFKHLKALNVDQFIRTIVETAETTRFKRDRPILLTLTQLVPLLAWLTAVIPTILLPRSCQKTQ